MDVYKTKSVYKAPGVYKTPGIYKDPSEVVLLNGVRYENRFYEIDSNNVGSTFVDEVRLPEGFEKLNRVWYNGTYGNDYPSLIETDIDLPIQFGDIYCGFSLVEVVREYYRIFYTGDENGTYKRTFYSSYGPSTSASGIRVWNSSFTVGSLGKSVQLSDKNKVNENLLSDNWMPLIPQTGAEPLSRRFNLLSSRGLCYFRFLFVADRNRQVTFTAIPCKYGSDYGLYDVVAGKFYTRPDFTGD